VRSGGGSLVWHV